VRQPLTVAAGVGRFGLRNGTLRNATVGGTGTLSVFFTTLPDGTLDAVVLDVSVIVDGSADLVLSGNSTINGSLTISPNALVTVSGGLTLNESITLTDTSTSGGVARLEFSGTQTLSGAGEIVFGPSTAFNANFVRPVGLGTLTVNSGITVRGRGGTLGGIDGATLLQGTVLVDVAGGLIDVVGDAFENHGSMGAENGGQLRVTNLAPNNGTLRAGAGGLLTVNGDFTQAASGTVVVELGGLATSQFGQLDVAGTLDVDLVNGFVPVLDDRFRFMTFASRVGLFDTVLDPVVGPGAGPHAG
jgi:hypothetical protein